jgi:hypothetical protein
MIMDRFQKAGKKDYAPWSQLVMVYQNVSVYHIACDQQLNALCDDERFLLFSFQIGVI